MKKNNYKIDYPIMKEILKTKLLLDGRRNSNESGSNEIQGDKVSFLRSHMIYIFMGLILIPFIYLGNYIVSISLLFSIFMVLILTSIITDFSSVLLDIRDNNIILTKPISSRSLNMAKILHIIYYMSKISLAIIGPSLLISLFIRGIYFFLIYLFAAILIDIFMIMIVALIYIFILKFYNGEKLKDIITYIQLGLSVAIALTSFLATRVFDITKIFVTRFHPKWWSYFIPSLWFSSFFEFLLNGNRNTYIIIYGILGIIMPILSIFLYIKFIPSFERSLQKLEEASGRKNSRKFIYKIGDLVCKTRDEKSFFRFTTDMIKSERNFKLRVYPSLGTSIIFPMIFLFTNGLEGIGDSNLYFSIYFIAMMISPLIQILGYSENYKAAFVFKLFSIDYNNMYRGSLKAIFFNIISPLFLLMAIIYLGIFNLQILPHLIVVYFNLLLITYLIFKFRDRVIPFSKEYGIMNKGNFTDFLKSSFIVFNLVGLHFAFTKLEYGVYIYLLILLITNKILWNKAFIRKGYNYGL